MVNCIAVASGHVIPSVRIIIYQTVSIGRSNIIRMPRSIGVMIVKGIYKARTIGVISITVVMDIKPSNSCNSISIIVYIYGAYL